MRTIALGVVLSGVLAGSALAAPLAPHPVAEAQALELAEKAIALRSVAGPGNRTPEVAALFKAALVAGGFAPDEVTITPLDDTAYLIARWRGRTPSSGRWSSQGIWTWSRPGRPTGGATRSRR